MSKNPTSNEQNNLHNNGNRKMKKQIMIIVVAAIVVIAIASAFFVDYYLDVKENERIQKEWSQQEQEQFKRQNELAQGYLDELTKRELDKSSSQDSEIIAGTYIIGGETDSDDPSTVFMTMRLYADATAKAINLEGNEVSGWWYSSAIGNLELVAVHFANLTTPKIYQVYNSHLIDVNSMYIGHVEKAPRFNSEFVFSTELGKMSIDITSDGKAEAEFIDTNKESENYGLKYAYAGDYVVDGDYISITLNTETTKFLMFDNNIENSDKDSGIASVYYQRYEEGE